MKAIKTTYLGPTNTRGSRIRATDEEGNTMTISYPHEAGQGEDAHRVAAEALCKRMNWSGKLAGGALKNCYVWVFVTREWK